MASQLRVDEIIASTGSSVAIGTAGGSVTLAGDFTVDTSKGLNVGTGATIFSPSSNVLTLGTNNAERVRISSSGHFIMPAGTFDLMVGDSTNSNAGTQTISVGSTASGSSGGIQLWANPTNGNSWVQFGDDSASASQYRGWVNYQHADDNLNFGTAGTERLRITSAGNVGIGTNAPTTGNTSGAKYLHIHNSSTSNSASPAEIYFTNADTGPSGGSGGLITFYNTGFYFWNYANDDILFGTGGLERFRFDHSETTLDLISSSKIRLRGSQSDGQRLAHINIGSDGGANSETRAIDIWGNWQDQESKSITYNHGSGANDMVAQSRVRYNTTPSSTYYEIGRFYHGQNTTAFPVRFVSTSTTTANLELDGNLVVPSGYGIDFSATSDAGGMTSELLDDYEEGTWTPTLNGFTNAGIFQTAHYIKIGRKVTVYLNIYQSSNNMSFTASSLISGLPYTTINSFHTAVSAVALDVSENTDIIASWLSPTTPVVKLKTASSSRRHLLLQVSYYTTT